jgi:hypothetical protein
MQQFAEDVLVPRCLAKDRRQRSIADLPLELAEKARTKYHLLLMPLEALASVTSRLSRMRRNWRATSGPHRHGSLSEVEQGQLLKILFVALEKQTWVDLFLTR